MIFKLGIMLGDQLPKVAGVIHMHPMSQLVDDDVINDARSKVDESPIEVQVPLKTAAAPPRRDGLEGNFLILNSHLFGKNLSSMTNVCMTTSA